MAATRLLIHQHTLIFQIAPTVPAAGLLQLS